MTKLNRQLGKEKKMTETSGCGSVMGMNQNLVNLYFSRFPASEIPENVVSEKIACGYKWTDEGALFNPRMAMPSTDCIAGVNPVETETLRVSLGELIGAGHGVSMREVETTIPVVTEAFDIGEEKPFFASKMPIAELRGIGEVNVTHGEQVESRPITREELVLAMKWAFGPSVITDLAAAATWHTGQKAGSVNHASKFTQLFRGKLSMLLDDLSNLEEIEDNEALEAAAEGKSFLRWSALWSITPTAQTRDDYGHSDLRWKMALEASKLVSRLRRAAVAEDLVANWGYEDRWSIGPREGMVVDRETTNDLNRVPRDEFAEAANVWEEIEAASKVNLFSQLFYKGGETIEELRNDKQVTRTAATGEKKCFSEERLYLMRKAHSREEYFRNQLWNVLTAPLSIIEKLGKALTAEYNLSIKKAAPGPSRANVASLAKKASDGNKQATRVLTDVKALGWLSGGRWVNTPLYGVAARKHVRETSTIKWMQELVRSIGGKVVVADNFRFVKAADWSNTCCKREHLDALQDAVSKRLGFADETVLASDEGILETLGDLGKWFRANYKPEWKSPAILALATECKANPSAKTATVEKALYWSKYGLVVKTASVQDKKRCYPGVPITQRVSHSVVDFGTMVISSDHILTRGSLTQLVQSDSRHIDGVVLSKSFAGEEVTYEELLETLHSFNR